MRVGLLLVLYASVCSAVSLQDLSLDEKIGQLLMVAAVSNTQYSESIQLFTTSSPYRMDPDYVASLIQNYHVGGVIFLGKAFDLHHAKGFMQEQIAVTRQFQSLSKKVPLMIGLDAEWGVGMRLEDGIVFPRAMTLGALAPEHDYLIENIAYCIGRHCRQLGVHINFAPVFDLNTNARNPVINCRSFGHDPQIVTRKAGLFARGIGQAGVMSCAKHFPGHGDTTVDSHWGTPTIHHDLKRLYEVELFPFRHIINAYIPSIMIAHVVVPALTHNNQHIIATVSPEIITKLLRHEFEFNGLVFTDGLGMRAVTDRYTPSEIAVKALKAGVDILLCPVDVPATVAAIKQAIAEGVLSEFDINKKVMRVLTAKEKYCMQQHVSFEGNKEDAQELRAAAYQAAITRLWGNTIITPGMHAACIVSAEQRHTVFIKTLLEFCSLDVYILEQLNEQAVNALNAADCVIVPLFLSERYYVGMGAQKYSSDLKKLKQTISTNMIFILFGCPYYCDEIQCEGEWIIAYESANEAQHATAHIILGSLVACGTLPISINAAFLGGVMSNCFL